MAQRDGYLIFVHGTNPDGDGPEMWVRVFPSMAAAQAEVNAAVSELIAEWAAEDAAPDEAFPDDVRKPVWDGFDDCVEGSWATKAWLYMSPDDEASSDPERSYEIRKVIVLEAAA